MTNLTKYALLISLLAVAMAGCSEMTTKGSSDEIDSKSAAVVPVEPNSSYQDERNQPVDTMIITARGWGAPPKQYYPDGNRRLMAMRAAKLDAYRSLAERIHGLRIWGGTTIGEMVLEQDQFKVLLDAYVVGAKVLSIMPQKDGNYEAIVEIEVDRNFLYHALAKRNGLMKVPAGFSVLPKTAYEIEQSVGAQTDGTPHKAGVVESRSHANFYFSD